MRRKPPLPFVGHKGPWINYIQKAAQCLPNGARVLDVFGGSGLCTLALREARPDLKVFWNDYDGTIFRYAHAAETELLRARLLEISPREKLPVNQFGNKNHCHTSAVLTDAQKAQVIEATTEHERRFGYVDELTIKRYLSAGVSVGKGSLLDIKTMRGHIAVTPIPVGVCREWYEELIKNRFNVDWSNCTSDVNEFLNGFDFYLLDPPYAGKECSTYKGGAENLKTLIQSLIDTQRCLLFTGDEDYYTTTGATKCCPGNAYKGGGHAERVDYCYNWWYLS